MTHQTVKEIVIDYNGGRGMRNIEIARKYGLSNATVRNILIRNGVYKPQRQPKRSNIEKSVYYQQRQDMKKKLDESIRLLKKVTQFHEAGTLPYKPLYLEIHKFLQDGKS